MIGMAQVILRGKKVDEINISGFNEYTEKM